MERYVTTLRVSKVLIVHHSPPGNNCSIGWKVGKVQRISLTSMDTEYLHIGYYAYKCMHSWHWLHLLHALLHVVTYRYSRHCVKETKVGWFLKLLPPQLASCSTESRTSHTHVLDVEHMHVGFECWLLGNLSVPLITKYSEMALTCDTFKISMHIGTCAEHCNVGGSHQCVWSLTQ